MKKRGAVQLGMSASSLRSGFGTQKSQVLLFLVQKFRNEVWLSLVERYVRDVEVASSNLVTSTKKEKKCREVLLFLFRWRLLI